MNVNINSYVKRLKRINLLDPLVEAIANSLQAGATTIDIIVLYSEGTDTEHYIQGLEIVDNGVGFTLENQNSFDEFMSQYKIEIGGRGVGRFSYLKVFSHVEYNSVYFDEGEYKRCHFVFNKGFSSSDFEVKKTNITETGTKLALFNVQKKYQGKKFSCKSLAEIEAYIKNKLLSEFLLKEDFLISLSAQDYESITIDRSDIPEFEEVAFEISPPRSNKSLIPSQEKFPFNIRYCFDDSITTNSFFCTENRTVKETGIKIQPVEETGGVFLVSSPYLDKHVDDFRTNYDIPKDAIITFPDILNNLRSQFSTIVEKKFPIIESQNTEALEAVKKDYPYLKRYISSEGTVGLIDKKDVVKTALRKQRKEKDNNIKEHHSLMKKYESKLQQHNVDEELVKEFIKHVEHTSEINKENLVEFVWYSDAILNFLNEVVEKRIGDESLIHNTIVKKGDAYYNSKEIVQAEQNNMWIFGHQFMGYNYIASDKTIADVLKGLDKSIVHELFNNKKPDIFIAMPSDNLEEVSDVVIFELKRIGVGYFDKLKGIEQIKTYASAIKKNIKELSMTWGFLVIDFCDEVLEYLEEDEDYIKVYTEHGKAFSWYFAKRKLMLTILDAKAMISMAKNRNRIFTDLLEDKMN